MSRRSLFASTIVTTFTSGAFATLLYTLPAPAPLNLKISATGAFMMAIGGIWKLAEDF